MTQEDAAGKPLNDQQKRFAEHYAATGNAYKSALSAGYSETTARAQGKRLLEHVGILSYLRTLTVPEQEASQGRIATAKERQEFWTAVMRGQVEASFVTKSGIRQGPPDHTARLRASEMLGKVQGDFRENAEDGKRSGLDDLVAFMREARNSRQDS